jgi:mono/diheme cytochrome c family protein
MRILLGFLVTAGLASIPAAAAPADAGKALYDKSCKSCHGAAGEGNPAIAKAMKVTLRPLGSKEVQAKHDTELKNDITKGVGKMKPVAGLTDKQAEDVVAFVRTLKK